jgi:RHH-type transcriptional regulator, rel operon repressor / antitoxin RelB
MLGVRLEPGIERRLEAIATKTGRSKSYYARKAIIEAIEDWEDVAVAIERLENPGKLYTLEEVKAELGLAD